MEKTKFIWMDGKLTPWDEAKVHVLTHTLHYGLGVFEGIRCYKTPKGPAVFRLREHMQRLVNSAKIFQMEVPFGVDELVKATVDTIRENGLEECYIRPLVYLGYGSMGLYPKDNPVKVSIAAWAWGAYLGEEGLENGINVKTSSFIRPHVNTNMTMAKVCGYYVNSQLAKKEAIQCGFDEGLLLDTEGYVGEGSGENIFIVRGGLIKTTPLTSVLEGITRDSMMAIAKDEGYEVREERFTRDEVYIADEAFFTGTAAEITPIRALDNRKIGSGSRGPITKKLQAIYFDAVKGKSDKYSGWLTFVK